MRPWVASFFREQEGRGQADAPFRPFLGSDGLIPVRYGNADGLLAVLVDLADGEIERVRPFLGLPIRGRLAVQRDRRRVGEGVADEGLDESLAVVLPVVRPGIGPDLVGEDTGRPAM